MTDLPVLHHSRFQPLADQAQQNSITHSTLDELPKMAVVQRIEELADIDFQYPSAVRVHGLLPQSLQRLMGAPTGPEAERAIDKVLLVDRSQQHHHRTLENLVLQRRDADRALLRRVACFGDVNTSDGWGSVKARLGSVQKRLEVGLQVLTVFVPRLAVHARRSPLAGAMVRFGEPRQIHQIRQGREAHLRRLARQLCYPFLSRGYDVRISKHPS